jgi:signal transduction histidine kinase
MNTAFLNQKYGWRTGHSFWLIAACLLSASYLLFGLGPYLGIIARAFANLALVASYLALLFQIRYWVTAKRNVPPIIYLAALVYLAVLELLRHHTTYALTSLVGHLVLSFLIGALVMQTLKLVRQTQSNQIKILAATLMVALVCAALRAGLPWFTNTALTDLFAENLLMSALRWIWILANCITFVTLMSYQAELTTERNEELNELLNAKEQLLRASSRASQLSHSGAKAGSIMHELRQPLSSILLGATAMRRTLPHVDGLQDTKQYITMIEQESRRSHEVMKKLEALFAVEQPSLEMLGLTGTIEKSLAVVAHRLVAEQIKVEKIYHRQCLVHGDGLQLESVMTNLVANAIDALHGVSYPKRIMISLTEQDGLCLLDIKDNGPGISTEVMPGLFNLFHTGRNQGTGIGLWLCRVIVQNHGGSIDGKNMPQGGASFRVTLPSATPTPAFAIKQN